MRKDRLLYLILTVIFVIMLMRFDLVSFAAVETTVSVDPATSYGMPGESFTVDIKVADVADLYGWEVNMSFDPSVVEVVNVTEGEFLKDQPEGTSGDSRIENEKGWATFSWLTVGKHTGKYGSGQLATVEFLILAKGESVLNITGTGTYLIEMLPPPAPPGQPPYQEIPHVTKNGFFSSLIVPPEAEFTLSPKSPPKNEPVTFNASASYDDEEIFSYKWDFGDGTTAIYVGANLTAIATHQYVTPGRKVVTLNVTDNIGLSDTKKADVWVRFTHDIAVIDVEVSQIEVEAGETVSIDVTVTNLGEEEESFNVAVYYDGTEIDTKPVTGLEPDANETLTFSWHTAEVAPDDYAISGEADVEGEGHSEDNVKSGGTVTVNPAGPAIPTTLVIAVIIIIVVGVGAFLYTRRKGAPTT